VGISLKSDISLIEHLNYLQNLYYLHYLKFLKILSRRESPSPSSFFLISSSSPSCHWNAFGL